MEEAVQTSQPKKIIKCKLSKGALVSLLVFLIVLLLVLGGWLYLKYIYGDGYGCLKMLPFPQCFAGKSIEYQSEPAIGYNLPVGTEIRAPFFVAFFDTNPEGYTEPIWFTLGIPETSSFIYVATHYNPNVSGGSGVERGELIGTIVEREDYFEEVSQSTFVVRTEDLEIKELYRF